MVQRSASKITKCEIILYLSDGNHKNSKEIRTHLENVLKVKQRTGVDRHLRELKNDSLILAVPKEKRQDTKISPGNGIPLIYSIDSDPSNVARLFLFMKDVDDNRYVKKFMLSEAYRKFVHNSVIGIRKMITKFDEKLLDYSKILESDDIEPSALLDFSDLQITSIVKNLVSRNWWGLEWILLTSPDASELFLEVLYWLEEFEKLWNKSGSNVNNEIQKEIMKKETNGLYKYQNFKRAIRYFERADNLRERYDKSGKMDTATFLIALLISDALAKIDYLNLVIPKSVYMELYNSLPIKRGNVS